MPEYVLYTPAVEVIADDEAETQQKIVELMKTGMANVREKDGRPERISHGKSFALLKARLDVPNGLAPELAQGLFSKPGSYDVLVRMANAPGEMADDSKVTSARGMSLKVLNVGGEHIQGDTSTVQDFVLDTGKEFFVGGPKAFLQAFQGNAHLAPKLSDSVKGAVSSVAAVAHDALKAVGIESQKLDFFGHKQFHPLAEAYYAQTPIRFGDYIAKFGVEPYSPELKAISEQVYEPEGYDGLRTIANDWFRSHDAVFDVVVQLNTDLDKMPVEDAKTAWPEDESPYRPAARLTIPAQTAYDSVKDNYFEYMSFSPAHSLEAHRPLGGLNRSRLKAYPELAKERLAQSGRTENQPASADVVPA